MARPARKAGEVSKEVPGLIDALKYYKHPTMGVETKREMRELARRGPPFTYEELVALIDYCEADVLNTYLIYLRFQLVRGELDAATYKSELAVVEAQLAQSDRPHLQQYLALWQTSRHEG